MGLEKFMDDANDIKITKKSYKSKVDNEVKNKFEQDIIIPAGLNLLDMEEEKSIKKTAISVYFKEEDLNLLKAISQTKNTTVNKTIMNILETTIKTTKDNLPKDFDVVKKAKEYDKRNKNKGNRKK
ncbi:hypothetical protein [Paraclostridium sordellii]|uniref:hypothetical protein n=1 Tax=Paraclostridium sordellii TaxID=1505 RepID=UPI0005E08888|nr:hypothetical protein [Paeniclostridium sordellii]CEN21121.1 Uncharacterised protein [[Clostridium] sordellii] [Paeniclostridium sordellii]CEP40399.1 Uncharacterised protein [[Clostridium] sordellii] [Paeniclostridium sordellii]CEP41168.1 Uncharacterised protein [[Clostridium] sordellii] [Paeniclostridium sordellii]CEP98546.1 Uncharacterised protein [[Clostridium] sordellii] [Paeniclostridium sordellii]